MRYQILVLEANESHLKHKVEALEAQVQELEQDNERLQEMNTILRQGAPSRSHCPLLPLLPPVVPPTASNAKLL